MAPIAKRGGYRLFAPTEIHDLTFGGCKFKGEAIRYLMGVITKWLGFTKPTRAPFISFASLNFDWIWLIV